MGHDDLVIIGRVAGAAGIGAMIGFERTFHGRPAGFRTHALVCIASAVLMIVTVYQNQWMTEVAHEAIRTDPTRMAQGIMTGIGFLGAGVIFKEGLTGPPRLPSWRHFGSSSCAFQLSSTHITR